MTEKFKEEDYEKWELIGLTFQFVDNLSKGTKEKLFIKILQNRFSGVLRHYHISEEEYMAYTASAILTPKEMYYDDDF